MLKLPSREQVYFTIMKWSKYHTNGCDLICSNKQCNKSYLSWHDNYPVTCKICGSKLWEPQEND